MAGSASGAASANTESSASTGASALRVSVIKGGGVQRLAVLCQRKLAQDPFAGGIRLFAVCGVRRAQHFCQLRFALGDGRKLKLRAFQRDRTFNVQAKRKLAVRVGEFVCIQTDGLIAGVRVHVLGKRAGQSAALVVAVLVVRVLLKAAERLLRRFIAAFGVGVLGKRADQSAAFIVAVLIVRVLFKAAKRLLFGILRRFRLLRSVRKQAVAEDFAVRIAVRLRDDGLAEIALDGLEAIVRNSGHNADVVGQTVRILVEEGQSAALRRAGRVKSGLRQKLDPAGAARLIREGAFRDPGVVQAEGGEHGAPVAVGRAVPCAVAGIAVYVAALVKNVIVCAFVITKLALRNGDQIVSPIAGKRGGKGALPDVRRFQIGFWVGIAEQRMLALFLVADQRFLIAGVAVLMRSGTGSALALGADQNGFHAVAVGGVCMLRAFLLTAGQHELGLVAGVRVFVNVLVGAERADQLALIAFLGVHMRFLSAVGLARHGDGGQDQRIRRAEHDDAGQNGHELAPAPEAGVLLPIALYLFRQAVLHDEDTS